MLKCRNPAACGAGGVDHPGEMRVYGRGNDAKPQREQLHVVLCQAHGISPGAVFRALADGGVSQTDRHG